MTPPHPAIFGIPIDFILFGLTLVCVAVFHQHTLRVALAGLFTVALYKILFTGFKMGTGLVGFVSHVKQEWVILTNLMCLLLGFAVLSRHFEKSHLTLVLPKYLPHDWKGGFVLLGVVWVLSSFLDNIAGALIGGALARELFRSKVHIGYVAAIVAASNAGGAWSVLGDTTTTMLWIAGVSPGQVFEAVIGAAVSLFVFGIPAAIKQHRYSPMLTHARTRMRIDWVRIAVIALILAFALVANVATNIKFPGYADRFPFIGVAVWTAILVSIVFRAPEWNVIPPAFRSSIFLLSLVLTASMMPVEELPVASCKTTLGPWICVGCFR
jgi:Na+/H+ antiporter NhaD/arsenite permease-like protein